MVIKEGEVMGGVGVSVEALLVVTVVAAVEVEVVAVIRIVAVAEVLLIFDTNVVAIVTAIKAYMQNWGCSRSLEVVVVE